MFNLKFIRGLVVLAVIAVLILPAYAYFLLAPSLKNFVVHNTEDEAVRVATHLAEMFVTSELIARENLPQNIDQIINNAKQDFGIRKVKIFSPLGEILYSTSPEDVGQINRKNYFHEIVATGNKFTKLVKKDTASEEGQYFLTDVVETYVPIMRSNAFAGAFEIYFDVTEHVSQLDKLLGNFNITLLPIAACLIAAMLFTLLRFRESFIERLRTERKLKENEERYRSLFEQSNDAILVSNDNGRIVEVNKRACKMLGLEKDNLSGMNVQDLINDRDRDQWSVVLQRTLAGENPKMETRVKTADDRTLDLTIRASGISRKRGLVQIILRDVTEYRQAEKEVKRGFQTQTVLNKLLHLSLEDLSLTETLELFIYYITSFPWLELEPKGAIFLVDEKPGTLKLHASRGLNEALLNICDTVPFGRCLCGKCALSGEVVFSNCIDAHHDNKYEGIQPHGHYCVPILSANKRLIGVFTLYIKHLAVRDKLAEETLQAAASVIAGVIQRKRAEEELQKAKDKLEIRVQERTVELEETNEQLETEIQEHRESEKALAIANNEKDELIINLFEIMYEMLANRDHSTFEHALRVSEISRRIGLELELSAEDMEVLKLGCLVHDIGKVAIPDDVLLKPGLFDRMDRNIMQVHTLVGASLFAKHHHDYRIRRIILHHHERLDGSGYPYGLKGDEIGLLERIVAVADVYEALVSRRPYKRPISRQRAIDILWYESREGRLDPDIVRIAEMVTETWSPLDISCEFRADYSQDLEVFRQMSYFREPLSDFYNYRYLLYLDDARLLARDDKPYHLILANFPEIKKFNKTMGFVKADQVLDEIGQKLHQTSEEFDARNGNRDNTVMLLRKGSDFLIYSECSDEEVEDLLEDISFHLENAKQDWGLDSKYHHYKFDNGYPADKALNRIFSVH
ncbi:MAG: PAS domain S-box protein [Proteobacteria bacterium]|nr:PAS domain S-box protein [Pseudomonadota bacterium]MBU1739467.1 PAS domain S-box protein [Pseudomonadota bacterium]